MAKYTTIPMSSQWPLYVHLLFTVSLVAVTTQQTTSKQLKKRQKTFTFTFPFCVLEWITFYELFGLFSDLHSSVLVLVFFYSTVFCLWSLSWLPACIWVHVNIVMFPLNRSVRRFWQRSQVWPTNRFTVRAMCNTISHASIAVNRNGITVSTHKKTWSFKWRSSDKV